MWESAEEFGALLVFAEHRRVKFRDLLSIKAVGFDLPV